jgi:predicted dehydrogenase
MKQPSLLTRDAGGHGQRSAVRTAVVGCGYWGRNLVRSFHRLSTLGVCCDLSDSARASIAASYPHVPVTHDFDVVLCDTEIDAVILATPARAHARMAIQALQMGKHVFVEKPLALTVAEAEAIVRAANEADRILMVGHLLKYHPAIARVKQVLEGGELGELLYIYSQRVNLGKVRSDENALWSLAPHDVAVILYLMGEEPTEVLASGQAFLQPGVEDVVFMTLRFASGRVAHVHVSWLDPHKERRLTVVGSQKMLVFNDMEATEKIRIYDKGVARHGTEQPPYDNYAEYLQLREGDITIPRLPNQEPLAVECAAFLRAVETGVEPLANGADGLAVIKVLEAAQRALESGFVGFEPAAARAGP